MHADEAGISTDGAQFGWSALSERAGVAYTSECAGLLTVRWFRDFVRGSGLSCQRLWQLSPAYILDWAGVLGIVSENREWSVGAF